MSVDTSQSELVDVVVYHAPASMELMVNFPHGQYQNFSAFFSADAETSGNYILGWVFACTTVAGIFWLWAMLIFMFFFCGKSRVGFLSGRAFHRWAKLPQTDGSIDKLADNNDGEIEASALDRNPTHSPVPLHITQYSPPIRTASVGQQPQGKTPDHKKGSELKAEAYEEPFNDEMSSVSAPYIEGHPGEERRRLKVLHVVSFGDSWCSKASLARVVFILCGLACSAFAILLVVQGLALLQSSADNFNDNAFHVFQDAEAAIRSTRLGMINLLDEAQAFRLSLLQQLALPNFCPTDPEVERGSFGPALRYQADVVVGELNRFGDYHKEDLNDAEFAFNEIHMRTTDVLEATEGTNFVDYRVAIVVTPYVVAPAVFTAAAIMAFFDVNQPLLDCFIDQFLFPTFAFMMFFSSVATAVAVSAVGINAELCLPGGESGEGAANSPEETLLQIIEFEGYPRASYIYNLMDFYVHQCQRNVDPFGGLRELLPKLVAHQQSVTSFGLQLSEDENIAELGVYCDRDFSDLQVHVGNMRDLLSVMVPSLSQVLDIASCSRMVPLYTNTFYTTACEYSPKAVFWVLCSCFVISVCGIMMITLRSSYKLTLIDKSLLQKSVPRKQEAAHSIPTNLASPRVRGAAIGDSKSRKKKPKSNPYEEFLANPAILVVRESIPPISTDRMEDDVRHTRGPSPVILPISANRQSENGTVDSSFVSRDSAFRPIDQSSTIDEFEEILTSATPPRETKLPQGFVSPKWTEDLPVSADLMIDASDVSGPSDDDEDDRPGSDESALEAIYDDPLDSDASFLPVIYDEPEESDNPVSEAPSNTDGSRDVPSNQWPDISDLSDPTHSLVELSHLDLAKENAILRDEVDVLNPDLGESESPVDAVEPMDFTSLSEDIEFAKRSHDGNENAAESTPYDLLSETDSDFEHAVAVDKSLALVGINDLSGIEEAESIQTKDVPPRDYSKRFARD